MVPRKKNLYITVIQGILLSGLMLSALQAAKPLWTLIPVAGNNPKQMVAKDSIAIMQYRVQNQSSKPKRLVIQPMRGITQSTPCWLSPKSQSGSSCILNLVITGSVLPMKGINGGPTLCQTNPNGIPNTNQCYQPSAINSLKISRGSGVGVTITATPSNLSFVAGSNSKVTVTNSITSKKPANNVIATIPKGSNISVQSTTCGKRLAIGANCTITFIAPAAEGPTNIAIHGVNTNTTNVAVTVTTAPMATISVNPTTLLFAENSTGDITITNESSSSVTANNVVATSPLGSNISVLNSTCVESLAIGANCTITFTSNTTEGPTLIPIAGDNTNILNVDVTATTLPQINITNPIQQSRIVSVSGMTPLSLEITNDAGSAVNANAITVSNNTGCPNLIVNDTNCASLAPGASCSLELTSNTPYIPCTITVQGSNTANSPQTLIAFSHLGGLVFEENSGSGKVVIDQAQEFNSAWTSTNLDIAGATSNVDGASNTNAIIVDTTCTNDVANCAAQRCQNISANWYLPARDELAVINNVLCSNGVTPCNFGGFQSTFYWSSTQGGDTTSAWLIFITSGGGVTDGKSVTHPVRCARAF